MACCNHNFVLAGLSALALAATMPAAAQQVDAGYNYYVQGGDPGTDFQFSATSVDLLPSTSVMQNNSVFGHYYATTGGAFGTRSSGQGLYTIVGASEFTQRITNSTVQSVDYKATYRIDAGELGVLVPATSAGQQTSVVTAQLSTTTGSVMTIRLSYQASLAYDSDTARTPSFNEMGDIVLNPDGPTLSEGMGSYTWSAYTGTVDLGILAPGESMDLSYVLGSGASGTTPFTETGPTEPPDDFASFRTAAVICGECGGDPGFTDGGSAIGRIGDPITLNDPALVITATPLTEVPEPASALLLGAGLAGLAWRRRARQAA